MALGRRNEELSPITRRWGVAGRVNLPLSVETEFRAACDAVGVAYKHAFAQLCGTNPARLRERIAAGREAAQGRYADAGVKETRLHMPEKLRDLLLTVGSRVEPGMALAAAGSYALISYAGSFENALRELNSQHVQTSA